MALWLVQRTHGRAIGVSIPTPEIVSVYGGKNS